MSRVHDSVNHVAATTPVASANRFPDDDLRLAAHVLVPVLLTSDSKGDREMCARLIHASGMNARGPFVSTPGWDDEAALRRQCDEAREGTLFIEDLTMLTGAAQHQLFALLDERVAGNSKHLPAGLPVRIISGASEHLAVEVAVGKFCAALFYRLNVVHLVMTASKVNGSAKTVD